MAVRRRADRDEKTLPWRRVATYATTTILLGLGVIMLRRARRAPRTDRPEPEPDALDVTIL